MKKRIFALLLSIAVIFSSLSCITVFADSTGVDSATAENIKSAFKTYVDSVGNSAAADTMVEYINSKVTNVTVSIANNTGDWTTDDWFIYHAVDGCYDEAEDYPISIPGNDGYVSAILTVSDKEGNLLGTVGAVASIPHIEENLGTLTTSVYSAENTDFTTDASGNITNYSGTAEKIVIPSTYIGIINLKDATSKDIVKAVVIGDRDATANLANVSIAEYSFQNWSSLRAVVLPYRLNTSGIGQYAFADNTNLKYVDLPNAIKGQGLIGYAAFIRCSVLENARNSSNKIMTNANYNQFIFKSTAIRYIAIGSGKGLANCTVSSATYSDGVFVRLDATANAAASLARAATLAQEAADKITVSADTTADSIANALTGAYSAKNANITGSWTTEPTIDTTALTVDNGVYTLALNGQTVDITVDIAAPEEEEVIIDSEISENIRNAFKDYVDSVGNSAAADTMVEYINSKVTDVTVSIANNTGDWTTDDWFIYHAVDGCYDETESYKLSIPGHDGYVSAILTVSDSNDNVLGTVGAVASIPHIEENLGNLSMSVYSADNTDFTTDADGNITNYSGTAEKIVIPYDFTKESKIINLANATSKDIVKVVMIGSRVANSTYSSFCHIEDNCFKNWGSLRAVSLPWRIKRSEGIGQYAFADNANLKYVDMPNAMAGTSSGYGTIYYGAFSNCPVLENAMCSHCGIMTTATYQNAFNNTAIRYMVVTSGSSLANCTVGSPAYSDGVFVRLDATSNVAASLARAATLAQEAAIKYGYDSDDNQNTVKSAIIAGYSDKTLSADITADWNDTFTVSNGIVSGTLTLTQGENSVPVEYYYNPNVGLSDLSINGVEISPVFSGSTYNYTASVVGTKNAIKINVLPVAGATIDFSSGSYALKDGENVFTIKPTLATGEVITYTLTVTRKELPTDLIGAIEEAFRTYVDSKGNNSDPDALLSYINKTIAPASVAYDTNGIFIRHAVDGVYDEGDDGYPINIKGHDGSVAVNLKVYDENEELVANYGDMAVIPHKDENLGTLTYEIFNYDAWSEALGGDGNFEIDEEGNITAYKGNAQKLIILDEHLEDGGYEKVGINLSAEGAVPNKDSIVAVVIGNSAEAEQSFTSMKLTIEAKSFSGWKSLRAVELPRRICGYIGAMAFAYNPVLKYVDTPQDIKANFDGTGYGPFRNEAFRDCPVLENINSSNPNTRMTTGQLWKQIYAGTAVRDYIYEGWYSHGDSGTPENIGANPTYSEGTQVIMAVGSNSGGTITPTFTRAATMAQEKATTLTVTADNAATAMAEITSTYNSTLKGVDAEWADDSYTELLLTYGEYTIPVTIGASKYNIAIELNMNSDSDFRTSAPIGVRYSYTVSGLDALKADESVASVELGTLIAPKDVIVTGLNHFDLDANGTEYLDIPAVYIVNNTVKAVISNIKNENLTRSFSAIGYALITYTDGTSKYVYADKYVTANAVASASDTLDNDSLTDDEKAILESLVAIAEDNAQNWIDTQYGSSDAAAMTMRNSILSSEAGEIDTSVYTGETYYITEENFETYKTTFSLIPEGSIVLFERGGTYRVGGIDVPQSNIYFGAFGEGAKPNIYGSIKNFADSDWTDEGANIWSVSDITDLTENDAGIVIFDDGKMAGTKKATKAEVTANGDFWYDQTNDKVYLYSEENPADIWNSIEIGVNDHIFEINNVNGITIDNLNIRYSGAHGVCINNAVGVTVTNCEIAYIGGSYMTHTPDKKTTRYGNGVELWCEGTDITVDNCWIHQIYDSGLTHQGTGSASANTLFDQKNITFSNNLVEYCGLAAIEYWASSSGSSTAFNNFENINYTGNILRFAGYGWGAQGVERTGWIIKTSNDCLNKIVKLEDETHTFYITGNIMDTGRYGLMDTAGSNYSSARPILSGNTYMQASGAVFGKLNSGYSGGASTGTTEYLVDETIESIISTKFKDLTATLVVY